MAARRRTEHSQGELFLAEPAWPPAAPVLPSGAPDLAFYDLIVANIIAGKDSQTGFASALSVRIVPPPASSITHSAP